MSRLVPARRMVGSRIRRGGFQDAGHLACQSGGSYRIRPSPRAESCDRQVGHAAVWGDRRNSTSPKNGMSRNRCVSTWPSCMRMTMSSWSTSPWASLHMLRPDGQAPPYWAACSNAACASPHTELPGGRASCRGWMVGTSGLMLVCKSELAYKEMRRQFSEHEVVKTYHAMVQATSRRTRPPSKRPSAAPRCRTSASASRRRASRRSRIGTCWTDSARRRWFR